MDAEGVGVVVAIGVAAGVTVACGDGDGLAEASGEAVAVGVAAGEAVGVGIAEGTAVGVGVPPGVAVGVGVGVSTGVGVGVSTGVGVGVASVAAPARDGDIHATVAIKATTSARTVPARRRARAWGAWSAQERRRERSDENTAGHLSRCAC